MILTPNFRFCKFNQEHTSSKISPNFKGIVIRVETKKNYALHL